jgi:hypothetical protein
LWAVIILDKFVELVNGTALFQEVTMKNGAFLFLVSFVVVALAASSVCAQGGKFGLGVEAENVSFALVNYMGAEGEMFFDFRTVSTTPAFLVSLRFMPNFFLEPSLGITTSSVNREGEGWTEDMSMRDIKFGLGGLYVFNPDQFVSPYVHAKFDLHSLLFKLEEEDWDAEVSAWAMTVAGGFGGMVNIKDHVFLTLEGRILYARQMDPETTTSDEMFEDTVETTQSAITTDMVLGLRVIF